MHIIHWKKYFSIVTSVHPEFLVSICFYKAPAMYPRLLFQIFFISCLGLQVWVVAASAPFRTHRTRDGILHFQVHLLTKVNQKVINALSILCIILVSTFSNFQRDLAAESPFDTGTWDSIVPIAASKAFPVIIGFRGGAPLAMTNDAKNMSTIVRYQPLIHVILTNSR